MKAMDKQSRDGLICQLREQGFQYKQIAKLFGLSAQQVANIHYSAKCDLIAPKYWHEGLPANIANVLINNKIHSKQDVVNGIASGVLGPKRVRGYGHRMHAVVCEWLSSNSK